jgi:hypothetical protein
MTFTQGAESPDTGNYYRFKVLAGRVWSTGNGYDEGERVSFRAIGSKTLSQADQRLALLRSMNGSNCTHDYDCCGCASTYASVRRVKPGVFAVQARTSYNY